MPYRIIVADPSPSVQKIAQMVFAEPEFRVFPFEDGISALEAAEGIRPDAVLVSLSLTARGGGEIGRALRSRSGLETVPILGLKGSFESPDLDRIEPSDYDGIVQKPFDSERLAASVRELIARKTGPSTLPEEPVRPGSEGPAETSAMSDDTKEACRAERGEPPGGPALRQEDRPAIPHPELREWLHGEMVGMEREIEKRVRARLLAELRERTSGEDREPGKKE